jgi:hypothetical protein
MYNCSISNKKIGVLQMENVEQIIKNLGLENQITLEDIPHIDLYMDQIIQLFENKFSESKRNDEEKVLTKTMINNYAKGKLLFPIKKKKYSKEHILLISLIYQLKGALSINDIKLTLDGINARIEEEAFDIEQFYQSYLNLAANNVGRFKEDIQARAIEAKEELGDVEVENSRNLDQILLISSLVHSSNLYRKAAEKLVDEL